MPTEPLHFVFICNMAMNSHEANCVFVLAHFDGFVLHVL